MSTLPALLNTFLGIVAFKLASLESAKSNEFKRLTYWFIFGITCVISGLFLHVSVIPISKQIWSTSFALVTSGITCCMLALVSWLVDIQQFLVKFHWTRSMEWFGSNSLVMYIVPLFGAGTLMNIPVHYSGATSTSEENLFNCIYYYTLKIWFPSTELAALIYAIVFQCLFWPLAWFLHWRKIFIKL